MSAEASVKVLTARVGYEFTLDDLRLSMLSTNAVMQQIADAFQFRAFGVATPPPTFGPVPNALPAGAVFQLGTWNMEHDSQVVPIRFLNIELQRIVIDVAGPSSALHDIYQRLREVVAATTAPDGSPIIGEPLRTLRLSELSVTLPVALDNILAPGVRALLTNYLPDLTTAEKSAGVTLASSLEARRLPDETPFSGTLAAGDGHTLSLSPRASTVPGQHVIYSGAPLETERHMRFINELVALLSPAADR
jgi:hypothetical protein